MERFEPTRLVEYSDSALIAEIVRVAQIVGLPKLTIADFEKHARVGRTTIIRRLGGWKMALDAAGLGHLYTGPSVISVRSQKQLGKHLSTAQMIGEVQAVGRQLGKSQLTKAEFDKYASISGDTVRKRFGTWKGVLDAASLERTAQGRRYTDEECYENLLNMWTQKGRQPKYEEMSLPPSTVGGKAYTLRWRTWNRAIHAFAEKIDRDLTEPNKNDGTELVDSTPITTTRAVGLTIPEADRHQIRLGLRYAVLRRDRFRCVVCGRSPATDLACQLHVDHIVAFANGGKTVLENLRCTCSGCNLGKADSD